MKISRAFLNAFLDADWFSFRAMKDVFFDLYELEGAEKEFLFESEYAKRINEEIDKMQTITLPISDTQLNFYCKRLKDERQFFAFVFAKLFDFTQEQIEVITSKRYSDDGYWALNYFICNPKANDIPVTAEQEKIRYTGKYYIYDRNNNLIGTAIKKDKDFIDEKTGQVYKRN